MLVSKQQNVPAGVFAALVHCTLVRSIVLCCNVQYNLALGGCGLSSHDT